MRRYPCRSAFSSGMTRYSFPISSDASSPLFSMQTANRVFALDGLFRSTRLTAPQVLVDGKPGRRPERTRAQSARRNALLDIGISALRRLPGVPTGAALPHY